MSNLRLLLGACALMQMLDSVSAADWQVNPSVSVSETYTSNVTLANRNQTASEDYITDISPSVRVDGNGGRLDVNGAYTMQNLFYAKDSDRNKVHQQFNLGADAELVKDLIYLDANSSLSQQLISSQSGIATDNINVGSGRGDVFTATITPRISRALGKFAEFDASHSEVWVNYENAYDSRVKSTAASLDSGRIFPLFSWHLGFNQSETYTDNVKNSERQSSDVSLRYRIHRELSLVANAGKEKGKISSAQTYNDGSYWSAGFFWEPSRYFSIEGTQGENDRQVRITWAPTSRTSLTASYMDREVGINASNSWNGNLSHRTKHSTWTLGHSEAITSNALLVFAGLEPRLLMVDDVIILDEDGRPLFFPLPVFDVVNEEFLRVQNTAGVSIRANKSTIRLNLADETRDYELSGRHVESQSGLLGWRWQLASRTKSDLSYSKTISKENVTSSETDTRVISLSVSRTIGRRSSGRVQVRRATSDQLATNTGYEENRVSAHFRMNF